MKPSIVVTSKESLDDVTRAMETIRPSSYVLHFESRGQLFLLKHKLGARKYMTAGKIFIPKKYSDEFYGKVEILLNDIMQKQYKDRINKIENELLKQG